VKEGGYLPMNKSGEQQKAQDVFAQIGRYTIWCEIFSFFYSEVTDFTYNIYSDYHAHRAFDIHYPIKGSYYIVTEKEKILAKAGQLVIIAPGVYHTSQAIDANEVSRFDFYLSFLRHTEDDNPLSGNRNEPSIVSAFSGVEHFAVVEDDFNAGAMLMEIHEESRGEKPGYYEKMQSLLMNLVIEVSRRLKPYDSATKILEDVRMETIERFFTSKVYSNASQQTLANRLNISPRHLNRLLLKLYGMSFQQKRVRSRIEQAKCWLTSTDKTVSEISASCGYEYESSFNHVFKKNTGLTPCEFRKQAREKKE